MCSGQAIASQAAMRASCTDSAMSAPNDQPARSSGTSSGRSADERLDRGEDIEPFAVAVLVVAAAALDPAEVEAQAVDAVVGQVGEECGDHDRAHRPAVTGVRVAEHHGRPGLAGRTGPLGFEGDPVAGLERQVLDRGVRHQEERRHHR